MFVSVCMSVRDNERERGMEKESQKARDRDREGEEKERDRYREGEEKERDRDRERKEEWKKICFAVGMQWVNCRWVCVCVYVCDFVCAMKTSCLSLVQRNVFYFFVFPSAAKLLYI